jgi:hypothetical protein
LSKKAPFDGFSGISLTEITLVPKMQIPSLESKNETSINFWHLLLGMFNWVPWKLKKRNGTTHTERKKIFAHSKER